VAPTRKFSQSSLVCAEPLKVYWFTLACGATLTKLISKRKLLECGTMKGEKRIVSFACKYARIRRVGQR
jgi:hypothetical protein